MRIINKIPKADDEKHFYLINSQWVQLKEPKKVSTAMFLSIPLMIINVLITMWIISLFTTVSPKDFGISNDAISIKIDLIIILGIVMILIIHELIHLILIPNFIKSDRTFVGVTCMSGFVFTEEILSRSRYIAISVAPFLVISIVLPVILGALGLLNTTIILLILLNAMGSSVDILNLILVLFQVPYKGQLTSNGRITYWR